MVKVADLGYQSQNLEQVPNKEESRDQLMKRALQNLTQVSPPEQLTPNPLPSSLFGQE